MPGASAREVEERVTKPMEKLLWEIPGVEYIYSTSSPGMSMAIVRFLVGQDEEKSIVRLNQKLTANLDLIPPGASPPLVKPRSIDDVPILALTFWSKRYGDFELRRIAAQVDDTIKQTPDVSAVTLIGGQRREVAHHARLSAPGGLQSLAACRLLAPWACRTAGCRRASSPAAIANIFSKPASSCAPPRMFATWWRASPTTKPIFVRDVAQVTDGGEEPSQYVRFSDGQGFYPAVTIAVSKRKGTNAVTVARERAAPSGAVARRRHSLRRRDDHHPQLRRHAPRRNRTSCCGTC